jgi:hypothetical protein
VSTSAVCPLVRPWLTRAKLSAQSVQTFIDNYPTALKQGWKVMPVTQLVRGLDVYRNAPDDVSPIVAPLDVAQAAPSAVPSFSVGLPSSTSAAPLSANSTAGTATSLLSVAIQASASASPRGNGTTSAAQRSGSRSLSPRLSSVSPIVMLIVALPATVAAQLFLS